VTLRDTAIASRFNPSSYLVTTLESETSIKVEQVRDLISSLSLTSPLPRLVLIKDAGQTTIVAQNALLKILEEPPLNTTFVLSTENISQLLPTIRSRGIQVAVKGTTPLEDKKPLVLLKQALSLPGGARINLADTLGKSREDFLNYLDSLLLALHESIAKGASRSQLVFLGNLAELASKSRAALKANANPALTIHEFFLSLPRLAPTARMGQA